MKFAALIVFQLATGYGWGDGGYSLPEYDTEAACYAQMMALQAEINRTPFSYVRMDAFTCIQVQGDVRRFEIIKENAGEFAGRV